MADQLKHFFSPSRVRAMGAALAAAHPPFDVQAFERRATRGLASLELMARGRHIMEAMRAGLPPAYPDALAVIVRSLGVPHSGDENLGGGMAPFFYLPHVDFVRVHGLDHFDASMEAQEALTQRFTCEWSVRPFMELDPERALGWLRRWRDHDNPHVRRLVSEGTRIRLPWAPRIPTWEKDLDRILEPVDPLRDDPSSMVRRSVANNLNDVAKVDPRRVVATATRWLGEPAIGTARRATVEHALRSLVKRGDPGALALLGFGGQARIDVGGARFSPPRVPIGESVTIAFDVTNRSRKRAALLVDLAIHFVKARGPAAKVFKLKRVDLEPGATATFSKRVSLAVHTTRQPRPGRHEVEVLVNGRATPLGAFTVAPARP